MPFQYTYLVLGPNLATRTTMKVVIYRSIFCPATSAQDTSFPTRVNGNKRRGVEHLSFRDYPAVVGGVVLLHFSHGDDAGFPVFWAFKNGPFYRINGGRSATDRLALLRVYQRGQVIQLAGGNLVLSGRFAVRAPLALCGRLFGPSPGGRKREGRHGRL